MLRADAWAPMAMTGGMSVAGTRAEAWGTPGSRDQKSALPTAMSREAAWKPSPPSMTCERREAELLTANRVLTGVARDAVRDAIDAIRASDTWTPEREDALRAHVAQLGHLDQHSNMATEQRVTVLQAQLDAHQRAYRALLRRHTSLLARNV